MKSIISELHLKFAEKSWKETFQLVRRCMDKPKDASKPCVPLLRSLERLQEVANVSSMNTMRSRLEMIAKQQGMGFHITEATCYLTADLFYLEVVLLPCGRADEVKVAPHGGSPVPSESFLQLLKLKKFSEFAMKLADLFTQYNIPGDSDQKLKLFASLQFLGKDLEQMSLLPCVPIDTDPQGDMINNGRLGCLIVGKADCPLFIQFYSHPTDGMKTSDLQEEEAKMTDGETVVQAALVTVHVSDVPCKLQTASVIPQPPQLDPRGYPVSLPLGEMPCEVLPACFLLKLQPAIPMMFPFVNKLKQITDVIIPDADLQWAALPKLLMSSSPSAKIHRETLEEQDTIFTAPLPGSVMHRYILPGAAWEVPALRGTVVDSIPFTHPAHVPALLELLRHQCAINTLLRSCMTSQCTGTGIGDPSLEENLSSIMKKSMSMPQALRTLFLKLEEITPAPLSASPEAPTEAENDHSAPTSTAVSDTNGALTMFSQNAAVPEDDFSASDSACYAKSELLPEINSSPAVSPYPFAPGGVFSHWMTNNGHLSELS
ncbi:mediator of RNA polymerase II transcription subunit 1-like isoform X5 [Eleginops maclovinus]|uniref:mediator of RNA polymerase II transcription subunit 1-like isoform X5 n=1 Tax=Eleginops maclovinus TaxID=56733 RepID=UPI00307FDCA7